MPLHCSKVGRIESIFNGFYGSTSYTNCEIEIFNSSQNEEAIEYVKTCGHQVALKAAGGKGVLIPETMQETYQVLMISWFPRSLEIDAGWSNTIIRLGSE